MKIPRTLPADTSCAAPSTEKGWSDLTPEQRIAVASKRPTETLARLDRFADLPDAASIVLHALVAPSNYMISPHHRASKLLSTYSGNSEQDKNRRSLIAIPLAEAVPGLYLDNAQLFAHMPAQQRAHCDQIAQAKPGISFVRQQQTRRSQAPAQTSRGIKPFQLSQGSRDGGASR